MGFSPAHKKKEGTCAKYMVIYRHKDKYRMSGMHRFFKVSRSGYYDYEKRMNPPAKELPLNEKPWNAKPNAARPMDSAECRYGLKGMVYTTNPKQWCVMYKYNRLLVIRRKNG